MKTLHLILKRKWYDMIASGEKKEEYREITPYWIKRILKCRQWCGVGEVYKPNPIPRCQFYQCENLQSLSKIAGGYIYVCFHRGYSNHTITFIIKDSLIGYGNPEWGAEPGKQYFVIKLGERI